MAGNNPEVGRYSIPVAKILCTESDGKNYSWQDNDAKDPEIQEKPKNQLIFLLPHIPIIPDIKQNAFCNALSLG